MQEIFNKILESELIVFATPIYSWYCTSPMKALLDRLVFGMNKYYGEEMGPAIWAGKKVAFISTCGYPAEKGADLFMEGMKRYSKHSQLKNVGIHVERDLGYGIEFMDEMKDERARTFARNVLKLCNND